MGAWAWLGQSWFPLAETLAILAGLLFTDATVRQDTRERHLANLVALTGQHRDIWKALYERPGLARLLSTAANPKREPLTRQEELFVTLLVLHLGTVPRAVKHGLVSPMGVQQDIRWFFPPAAAAGGVGGRQGFPGPGIRRVRRGVPASGRGRFGVRSL